MTDLATHHQPATTKAKVAAALGGRRVRLHQPFARKQTFGPFPLDVSPAAFS